MSRSQYGHALESIPQLKIDHKQVKVLFLQTTDTVFVCCRCLTEGEGVESLTGQSHAAAESKEAEKRERGRESSTGSTHSHEQMGDDQQHPPAISMYIRVKAKVSKTLKM